MEKLCPSCNKMLDYTCFGKNKSKKDGLQNYCKGCRKAQAEQSAERIAIYQKEYRKKNADRLSQAAKEKYSANPEYYKEKAKAWRDANPERKKNLDRRWQQNNKDRVNINCARRRAWKQSIQSVKYTAEDLLGKLVVWKYRCYLCDELLDDTLHWDHVKPLRAGGADMLCNLRPAHGSCNMSKGGKWPLER